MNISKREQRALHALAQGGCIRHERGANHKVKGVRLITRDGFILTDCDLPLFQRLHRRGLLASRNGAPYRISLRGLRAVRGQVNNQ